MVSASSGPLLSQRTSGLIGLSVTAVLCQVFPWKQQVPECMVTCARDLTQTSAQCSCLLFREGDGLMLGTKHIS